MLKMERTLGLNGIKDMSDNQPIHRCKNCGATCGSNYCPECGQAVSVGRLENRTFLIEMLSGLFRINRGFLFTAWNLIIHPWKVIRDYLHGRRVIYTPPVNMLVILCFIESFLIGFSSVIDNTPELHQAMPDGSVWYRIGVSLGDFFRHNSIIENLAISIPALIAVPIVYWKAGATRYNLAEYFMATIFMIDASIAFDILTFPLHFIAPAINDTASLIYLVAICGASLYFAFPYPSRHSRIRHFVYYILTVVFIYFTIAISMAYPFL